MLRLANNLICEEKEQEMVSLKTQIAGFSFDNCLMNAAGVSCMTVEELEAVRQSSAGTFITKTATLTPRQGNPEPRYRDVPLGSINSMGLPNQGIEFTIWITYLPFKSLSRNGHFFSHWSGCRPMKRTRC